TPPGDGIADQTVPFQRNRTSAWPASSANPATTTSLFGSTCRRDAENQVTPETSGAQAVPVHRTGPLPIPKISPFGAAATDVKNVTELPKADQAVPSHRAA